MPDIAELLSELDGLSERPPGAPRPVAEIRHRARRRRHRRRVRRGGLAAAALVAVTAVGVVALRSDDDGGGPDVDTGPVAPPSDPEAAPPTTVDDDGVVRLLEGRGLTLDPADDLADGAWVVLTLTPEPPGPVDVTQCAAEVVDYAGSLDPAAAAWCGSTFSLRHQGGTADMGFMVNRRLGTTRGTIDCAEAPGRCVLVARSMTASRSGEGAAGEARAADAVTRSYAPLVFRDDLPPLPAAEARLVDIRGALADGQVVRFEASGFGRVSDILISQCTGPADDLVTAGEATLAERCDGVRYVRARTDDAGAAAGEVRIFHDIGIADAADTTWAPCTPCSLVVRDGVARGNVVLPLDVVPTDDPIHPAMQVTPAGPYQPDQQLRIEGSGFQVRADVAIGLCGTMAVEGEAPACSYARTAYPTTDDQGAFVVDSLPLSTLAIGVAHCGEGPGACALHWQRDGVPVADVPLDVSG